MKICRTLLALALYACLLPALGSAQTEGEQHVTANTLRSVPGAPPPAATLEDLAWLAGSWRGEGLGGTVEEIWSAPSAGFMMGGFQLNREGKASFFEFLLISREAEGLVLRLKHFNPDFSGWEEKEDFVSFPLVKTEPNAAFFRGLTYKRVDDELHIFLALSQGGETSEVPFVLHRVAD